MRLYSMCLRFALKEPYATRYTTSRDLLAHRTGLPSFGGDLLGKLGYSSAEILNASATLSLPQVFAIGPIIRMWVFLWRVSC